MASVFSWLRVNPGAVPGEYLLEWVLVRAAGASSLVARLPSLAAWALTAVAMVRIGSRAGVRAAETLMLVTAVTPMLFRYAIEGRPYMPAFCMTAFATLELLAIVAKPETKPRLATVLPLCRFADCGSDDAGDCRYSDPGACRCSCSQTDRSGAIARGRRCSRRPSS